MATRCDENRPEAERLHLGAAGAGRAGGPGGENPGGATPKELGLALGIHLSTTYRLAGTPSSRPGLAARDGGGLFRLGVAGGLPAPWLHDVTPPAASGAPFRLMRCSWPRPRRPCSINWRATTLSPRRSSLEPGPGGHSTGLRGHGRPAHALAAGRVLLAALPATQLDTILNRLTAHPAVRPSADRPRCAADRARKRIRHAGYALDHGTGYPNLPPRRGPDARRRRRGGGGNRHRSALRALSAEGAGAGDWPSWPSPAPTSGDLRLAASEREVGSSSP